MKATLLVLSCFVVGCEEMPGKEKAKTGAPGRDAEPCYVTQEDDTGVTLRCPESTVFIPKAKDGEAGKDSTVAGPAGKDGESIQGPRGEAGESIVGPRGESGRDGVDGVDATPIEMIELCPGFEPTYPNIFVEVLACIDNKLYGVYSSGAFLAELPPGVYSSVGINATCTVKVEEGCKVTQQ